MPRVTEHGLHIERRKSKIYHVTVFTTSGSYKLLPMTATRFNRWLERNRSVVFKVETVESAILPHHG